jgi:tetratricopeptide (TPR) repeat protein
VKRILALLVVACGTLSAQIPRAQPVDPPLRPDSAVDLFARGKNLYDSAQASTDLENRQLCFERAAGIFTTYLNEFANHPNAEMAWWYLGNSYYQGGQLDEGKRCFHTLLNRYGKGKWAAAAAYTLAADHYNKGEYNLAAPLFERFAQNAARPEDRSRGTYFAGTCYRMLGQDREATAAFLKVLGDPAGVLFAPQSKLALAHLAVKAAKLPDALELYEQIVASPCQIKFRGEAALHAALTATKLEQPALAEKYLGLVMTTPGMESFRLDAQTALMASCFAKQEYLKVIETFRSSTLKAEGENEATRLMIVARAYLRLKKPNDALTIFREVEKLVEPEHDMAFQASYYRLLCFLQIEGRHLPDQVDGFLEIYRKSRSDDPRIHTALLMKAETLFSNKDIAAAAKVYSEINASRISEKNRSGLFYQRGWCLAEAGDPQGAVRSLSDFINKYPQDPRLASAIAKRASAYAASAEPANAIKDFDRLTAAGTPAELTAFAWLESARLRRSEGNLADMITRYKGLLENVTDLSPKLEAEANYWIGQGLTKTNASKDAVPYLEKARKLRPETYAKHAGLLLTLGYFAAQDAKNLVTEIDRAIKDQYDSDIPEQILQWAGMQTYNADDFAAAARFLNLVANPKEPRETPKEVWRYLAKARLETGDAQGALDAATNVLEVEDNPGWKADGLLDRGRALFALKRPADARIATDEALVLRPQGRTKAGLLILSGDLKLLEKDLGGAAAEYTIVVEFHDDKDLKPLALSKLITILEAQNDPTGAAKYRSQLQAEFPAWKTPAPETPAPEIPAPETPAPEIPAPETPAPETPAPETPAPETPAPEIPAPETPATETPAPETPAPETPASETPASGDPASEDPAPKALAPKATVPKVAAPKATAPKATAPKATAPKATVPKATVPKVAAPKAPAPKAPAPKAPAPKAPAPKTPAPKTTEP